MFRSNLAVVYYRLINAFEDCKLIGNAADICGVIILQLFLLRLREKAVIIIAVFEWSKIDVL